MRASLYALLVLLGFVFPAAAQENGNENTFFQVQFYSGYEPFSLNDAYFAVETGGEYDYSLVGTRLVIDQKACRNIYTAGVRLGVQHRQAGAFLRHNAYVDLTTNAFSGPMHVVKGALQYEPEYFRDNAFISGFIVISLGLTYIWETLGEVGGSDARDLYFEAPDETRFPKGSVITLDSDILFNGALYGGIRIYVNRYSNIFVLGGYEFGKAANRWNVHISDIDDSEIAYSFPDTPFPQIPASVTQRGAFYRIGFSIGIIER